METWSLQDLQARSNGQKKVSKQSSQPLLLLDEVFEILEGTMGYVFEGKEGLLQAGQKATLPAGKPHTFWNAEPTKLLRQKASLPDFLKLRH